MTLPISPQFAMLAVKALLRFRDRVDSILSLQEATADLPFALPPAPVDTQQHLDEMFAFFDSERGQLVLELNAMAADYATVKARPNAVSNRELRRLVFQLFYEASDAVPVVLGPSQQQRARADADMRLAYYVVTSERLSRNPAIARVLLTAADTLMEFAGENAGAMIANPKTAAIVQTVLHEFAIKRDFDDDGAADLFQNLLGSAVLAVAEHGKEMSDVPVVRALLGALADAREDFGDEFVAKILSKDGFGRLLQRFVTHVAEDPALQPDDPRLRAVLHDTLAAVRERAPQLLDDPKAILSVLEVSLGAATEQVDVLLSGKLGSQPLIPHVVGAIAKEVSDRARNNRLFRSVASGEIVGAVLRASLATIAENADELGTSGKVNGLVAGMIPARSPIPSPFESWKLRG